MAQKLEKLELDPRRLVVLERQRQAKRAIARGLNDTLADLRERRTDVQRRAQQARANADYSDPQARFGYEQEASRLDGEVAALSQRMADTSAQIDETSAEAIAAGATAKSALQYAVERNLEIPLELRDAAHRLSVGVHPTGLTVTDGGAK